MRLRLFSRGAAWRLGVFFGLPRVQGRQRAWSLDGPRPRSYADHTLDYRGAWAFFMGLAASCSSTGSVAPPLLVGQWREVSDSGGAQFMFFDSDGTCGEGSMGPRGQSYCQACTYRYESGSIYISALSTVRNVPVTLTYDTLTIRNMGIYPDVVYARDSSVPSGRCP